MKKSTYLKAFIGLGLIGTVALASDIEINDEQKDLSIKSSIQLNDEVSESAEKSAAKIDAYDVCKILKKIESGKIVKVKLENEDGNLVYTSEVVTKNGENLDYIIDAGNGKILYKKIDKNDKEEDDEDTNSRG